LSFKSVMPNLMAAGTCTNRFFQEKQS